MRILPLFGFARRQRIFLLSLLVLPLLIACGGGGMNSFMNMNMAPSGPPVSFAIISNSGSSSVSVFGVSASGALSPVSGSPFAAGAGAEFMAFDPIHKFLFVSDQNANSLSVFSVNTSTGMLSPVAGSPFAVGQMPHGVAVDPAGKFVFIGDQNNNSVSAFAINPATGALTPAPGSPFGGVDSPFGLAVDPAGKFLYVNNFNANSVSAFQIDSATGALTPAPGFTTPTGQTPIGLLADPNGKFIYVADHMSSTVSAYQVDASTGALSRLSGPVAGAATCGSTCHLNPLRMAIDPKDRFLFASNVGANTLSGFSLMNGSLSPLAETPATGQHPFGVAFDPSGAFLFVINKVDNTISAFSVDSTSGALTALAGSPFSEGASAPIGILTIAKQ